MKVQTSRQFLSRLASRRAARLFRVAALFTVGAISTARAATPYYWDPGASKSGTGSGGTGTWNTTLTNWYPGTGAVDVVWPNTTAYSAYFGGTAGTVTLGTAITADSVSFAVGGYTLATGANTLTLGGLSGTGVNSLIYAAAGTTAISGTIAITGATASNTEYITVASGAILNLSATVTQGNLANSGLTIFGPGTVNYSGALLSPGKFNVQGGATFNSSTNIALTTNGTYTGVADTVSGTTWNITGGIVGGTPTSTPTAVSALFVGNGAGTSGLFTISGGTALFTGIAAGNTFNGALTAGAGTGDSTGTVTISGGTLTDTGGVSLGSAKSGVGTLNLNGGTMNVGGVFSQNAGVTGTGGSSTVNFNGTQLNLTGSTATEIPTGYNLNVGTGGALISTTNSYGFLSPLLNVSGTDGGLKKSGTGTLVLAGQGATYNGGTALNAGTLTGQNNTTATTLTTFGTGTITLNAGTLSLVANGSANNQTIITGNGTTGNNVTVAGASTINVDRVTAATNGGTVGTFTGSAFQFNNLSIGAPTLSITSGNSYGVQFAGTTTLTANATFSIINSTLTLSGAIGDGGSGYSLTKTGSSGTTTLSSLTLGGANTYTGATTVINPSTGFNTSGITLSGSGTINTTSVVNISGNGTFAGSSTNSGSGYMTLDNSVTALERIKNTAAVNLSSGGELRLVGNSAGVTETIGVLGMGTGQSLVTLTAGGAGVVTTLQAASLSRTNLGTGTVRGTSLGNLATNSTRIFLTTAPTGANFVGTSTASSLSGGTSIKNLKIVPWLVGDTNTGSGNYGGQFVTYDTQSGLRPLTSNEISTLTNAYATTGENVQVTGGAVTLSTTGASSFNSLYLASTGTGLTGSGGSLTISSGALGSGAVVGTTVGGFSVINLDNGEGLYEGNGNLTVSSPIDVTSGGVHLSSGGFTKGGNNTLILTGANLFSGATTINQGTLQVGAGGATGDLGTTSGVTVDPGATLSLVQATGSTFAYNVVNNGNLSVTNAGTENLSGSISGIGGITQATAATTLTLSGTNSYTGATAVSNGTLALTGSITGSSVTVSGTGVFTESSTGVIGGTGSTFTLTAGTATLAGQNTYSGGTNFTAGTLNIAADGTTTSGPLGTGPLTLSTGGTLQATGGAHAIANAVVNGGTSAVVGGSNNLTFNGIYTTNTSGTILTVNNTGLTTFAGGINIRPDNQAIRTTSFAGTGNVLVSGVVADGLTGASGGVLGYQGTGTLTLTAANTYTGSTTITSGTVQLGNGGTTGSLNVNAGIADAGTFTINRSNAISQATSFGTISGTGAVSLIGTGTTAFTKANTYTGVTTINRGALDLGGSTTTGSIGTVTAGNGSGGGLVLGGGALSFTRTGTNTQTFSGTTLNSGGSGITSAVSTDTIALGAITRNSGGTVNFAGPGVITTPTANTATSILGGWATYGSNDWAVSAGNGTTAGNITALPNASYFTYNNVSGLVGAGAGGTNLTDDTTGYDGTYTANLTVNSLRFNASGGDGNFGVVSGNNLTVTSGGILVTNNVGSKYQRIGFLNGSYIAGQGQGGITTSATDLVINQNNSGGGHLEIYSAIFGGLNLVKSGVGYFELRGLDASYTGSTVVNGGTMQLTAATTGTTSVVVNSGTLLLGANDRINDAATVTLNGGTINTGGSKEGNATGSSAATAGLGALTLSTSSTLDFGSGHTGSSVLAFGASNTQTWNGILTLLDFTPGTDFLNFASSTGLTATQLGEISLAGFSATGLDSFGDLTFTAVPEPATVFGGVFVVGALGWHLRRRNRRQSA